MNCNEVKVEELERHNGSCVMDALLFLNREVTEDDLLKCFTRSTTSSNNRQLLKEELKRKLHDGVVNGFILRNGNKYAIPSLEDMYEADDHRSLASSEEEEEDDDDEEKRGDEGETKVQKPTIALPPKRQPLQIVERTFNLPSSLPNRSPALFTVSAQSTSKIQLNVEFDGEPPSKKFKEE